MSCHTNCDADLVVWLILFFIGTATTEIYTYGHTLSLHDAHPISRIDCCTQDAGQWGAPRALGRELGRGNRLPAISSFRLSPGSTRWNWGWKDRYLDQRGGRAGIHCKLFRRCGMAQGCSLGCSRGRTIKSGSERHYEPNECRTLSARF